MKKIEWRAGNMVYPVPAVMVSLGDSPEDYNIITIAWTGTICSDPAMTYISVRKERHSHSILTKTGTFVINLTTRKLAKATDYCGVKSGRDVDKFKEMHLTAIPAVHTSAPMIAECPVNIECQVVEVKELGSHDMFLAKVIAVHVNESLMDEGGRLMLEKAGLITYSHGHYYGIDATPLGKFGYSIEKPTTIKKRMAKEKPRRRSIKNKI